MFPKTTRLPDLNVMKAVLKTLVEVFGAGAVYKEARFQNDLATVDRVARYMGKDSPKIARIKAVNAMSMTAGLREAKEWVEEFCPNEGHDPIS